MVVGGGLWDGNGTAFLFRSADLERWEYLAPLATGPEPGNETEWRGAWECPLFWSLNGRSVLIVSSLDIRSDPPRARVLAMSGRYEGGRFETLVRHRFDYGDAFYAPNVLRTDEGSTVLWAWLRECRSGELSTASTWSGCLTLPRHVGLDEKGRVVMEPAPEVIRLRRVTHRWSPNAGDPVTWLSAHSGSSLEIELEWSALVSRRRGLAVCVAEDGSEETRILHDSDRAELLVERASSRAEGLSLTRSETLRAPLERRAETPLRLRVFVDQSVLEVFTGTTACISTRIYPSPGRSRGLRLIGEVEGLTTLCLHEMG
jgi:beta-fructofuranosidase